jgi:hypothetical protein
VTPCAHMLCAGCASSDSTACVAAGCGVKYVMQAVDDLARCARPPACINVMARARKGRE